MPFNSAGYWNGLNGPAWDTTTVNWSTNRSANPLGSDTFPAAMSLSGGNAYFKDSYFNSGSPVTVAQTSVTQALSPVTEGQ